MTYISTSLYTREKKTWYMISFYIQESYTKWEADNEDKQ